jgi:hypothetical protein
VREGSSPSEGACVHLADTGSTEVLDFSLRRSQGVSPPRGFGCEHGLLVISETSGCNPSLSDVSMSPMSCTHIPAADPDIRRSGLALHGVGIWATGASTTKQSRSFAFGHFPVVSRPWRTVSAGPAGALGTVPGFPTRCYIGPSHFGLRRSESSDCYSSMSLCRAVASRSTLAPGGAHGRIGSHAGATWLWRSSQIPSQQRSYAG